MCCAERPHAGDARTVQEGRACCVQSLLSTSSLLRAMMLFMYPPHAWRLLSTVMCASAEKRAERYHVGCFTAMPGVVLSDTTPLQWAKIPRKRVPDLRSLPYTL